MSCPQLQREEKTPQGASSCLHQRSPAMEAELQGPGGTGTTLPHRQMEQQVLGRVSSINQPSSLLCRTSRPSNYRQLKRAATSLLHTRPAMELLPSPENRTYQSSRFEKGAIQVFAVRSVPRSAHGRSCAALRSGAAVIRVGGDRRCRGIKSEHMARPAASTPNSASETRPPPPARLSATCLA